MALVHDNTRTHTTNACITYRPVPWGRVGAQLAPPTLLLPPSTTGVPPVNGLGQAGARQTGKGGVEQGLARAHGLVLHTQAGAIWQNVLQGGTSHQARVCGMPSRRRGVRMGQPHLQNGTGRLTPHVQCGCHPVPTSGRRCNHTKALLQLRQFTAERRRVETFARGRQKAAKVLTHASATAHSGGHAYYGWWARWDMHTAMRNKACRRPRGASGTRMWHGGGGGRKGFADPIEPRTPGVLRRRCA
jgi:hypothetical protein